MYADTTSVRSLNTIFTLLVSVAIELEDF